MGFIADIVSAAVDFVVAIIEAVLQVVEVVIEFLLSLIGFEDQIVEYYDVQNIALFEDPDTHNQLTNILVGSILSNSDIASDIIYYSAFRTLKGDLRKFIKFIDDGNYFEGFPELESAITPVNYGEIVEVLTTLHSEACTIDRAYVGFLPVEEWVKWWLQENKDYDVGLNRLGTEFSEVTTTPGSTSSSVTITPSANHYQVDITDGVAVYDELLADARWQVNFSNIVYNSGSDDYTVSIFNDDGDTDTLPYTVPSKATEMHDVAYYYINSDPGRQYIFVYKVGSGVYPGLVAGDLLILDDPESPIDIDASVLQAIPAIPLRISNDNYNDVSVPGYSATKQAQIDDLCLLLNLDAAAMLDSILTDPGNAPGDLDNIYINFGVRMWDTSQAGMGYLFNTFLNLFPTQSITQGAYNDMPSADRKTHNNIIVTTEDYKYAFQFSYITYEHTTLAEINADSGSIENGIYYSDLSKFDSDSVLVYPYYSSSGKGTYNVGYKADTLAEVALFLAGSGVVNPGDTSGEATDWLQVTTRMRYTEPLEDPDGSTSAALYLTADLVYENVLGVLRHVQQAAEPTTIGQSITYYRIGISGLDAYTVVAPIGVMRVEDGDTGHFRMVKFNLGARDDLMVPFIYSYVTELSNSDMTQLFLAGTHISIYIAHYEVIELSFFQKLLGIVLIIIIIIVTIVSWGQLTAPTVGAAGGVTTAVGTTAGGVTVSGTATIATVGTTTTVTVAGQAVTSATITTVAGGTGIVTSATFGGALGAGILGSASVVWTTTALNFAVSALVQQALKFAITSIAGKDSTFAAIASLGASFTSFGYTPGGTGVGTFNVGFRDITSIIDVTKIFASFTDYISIVINSYVEGEFDTLAQDRRTWGIENELRNDVLGDIQKALRQTSTSGARSLIGESTRGNLKNPTDPATYYALYTAQVDTLQYMDYNYDAKINQALALPMTTFA